MKIERETKKINGEGRIVLDDDILKEPNFELLKEMLHLGDDVEEVRISFKQYDVRRKIKQDQHGFKQKGENMNELENAIKSLTSLTYFDWIKVRNTVDRLFANKIHDAKRDIHITEKDLENINLQQFE